MILGFRNSIDYGECWLIFYFGMPAILSSLCPDCGLSQDVFICQDIFILNHPDSGPKDRDCQDGLGYWLLSTGFRALGIQYPIPYWALGVGYWILGTKTS